MTRTLGAILLSLLAGPVFGADPALLRVSPAAPTTADDIELLVLADEYGDLCGAALALAPFTAESAELNVLHAVTQPSAGCPAVVQEVTLRFRLGRLAAGQHTVNYWTASYGGEPAEIVHTLTFTVREQAGEPLLLRGGRLAVRATWQDFAGNQGVANFVPGATAESGLLWFFTAGNWELLVKVLDGCAVNDRLWVLGSGATTVGFTVQIVDTETGEAWTHVNPLGQPAGTFVDTSALRDACN